MSLGWVAIGSLRIQRKGAMETGSGVLLPAVLPVASPIVAPKGFFFLKYMPKRRAQVHSKEGALSAHS